MRESAGSSIEIAERLYDAVDRGDAEAFIALHDGDAELVPLILGLEGGGYRGHVGVRRFWEDIHEAFPDWRWQVEWIRGFDEGTIAEVRIRGHGVGSGVTVDQRAWHVTRVRDRKVVWWRVFESEAEAVEAAGLRG